jgi:hypothetical protein
VLLCINELLIGSNTVSACPQILYKHNEVFSDDELSADVVSKVSANDVKLSCPYVLFTSTTQSMLSVFSTKSILCGINRTCVSNILQINPLIMETNTVSEALDSISIFIRLIVRENFVSYNRLETSNHVLYYKRVEHCMIHVLHSANTVSPVLIHIHLILLYLFSLVMNDFEKYVISAFLCRLSREDEHMINFIHFNFINTMM